MLYPVQQHLSELGLDVLMPHPREVAMGAHWVHSEYIFFEQLHVNGNHFVK